MSIFSLNKISEEELNNKIDELLETGTEEDLQNYINSLERDKLISGANYLIDKAQELISKMKENALKVIK